MVRVKSVSSGSRRFVFVEPLDVEIDSEDGAWRLEHRASGLRSHGPSFEAAMANFAEDVAYCWDAYVMADASELADRALQIRTRLREIVARIDAA
jgi:hypothetical protein